MVSGTHVSAFQPDLVLRLSLVWPAVAAGIGRCGRRLAGIGGCRRGAPSCADQAGPHSEQRVCRNMGGMQRGIDANLLGSTSLINNDCDTMATATVTITITLTVTLTLLVTVL